MTAPGHSRPCTPGAHCCVTLARPGAMSRSGGSAEHHFRWRNDPEVVRWASGGDPSFGPVTAEAVGLGFDTMLRLSPRDSAVFTVEDLAGGKVIGMADYRDLDPYVGVATLGVTIGEREFWGRRHGSDALRLLVDHLFRAYCLSRLELDTWSGNDHAVRACPSLRPGEAPRGRPACGLRCSCRAAYGGCSTGFVAVGPLLHQEACGDPVESLAAAGGLARVGPGAGCARWASRSSRSGHRMSG
ncbi:GNAT family N-acetyltransferase [Streptomyces sp. NPDC056309]|uniref:GNAT family N-acetyltransferase n=1 Tax=unclassified Streptomyces TaxID=2593676 RepID=UPI0035DBD272